MSVILFSLYDTTIRVTVVTLLSEMGIGPLTVETEKTFCSGVVFVVIAFQNGYQLDDGNFQSPDSTITGTTRKNHKLSPSLSLSLSPVSYTHLIN